MFFTTVIPCFSGCPCLQNRSPAAITSSGQVPACLALSVISSAPPRPTACVPGMVATPPAYSSVLNPLLPTSRPLFRLILSCELPLLSHHGTLKSSSLFTTWPQIPFLWTTFPGSCHNWSLLTSHAGSNYTNINNPSIWVTFHLHSNPMR